MNSSVLLSRMSGSRKLFQASKATMIPRAPRPGRMRGTITEKNVRSREAPSSMAASSSSRGRDRINCLAKKMPNGLTSIPGMMSDRWESTHPSLLIRM